MKSRSRRMRDLARAAGIAALLAAAGCASPTVGDSAASFVTPQIEQAYIPLSGPIGVLDHGFGAAMTIAPGIAVTNAHNRPLIAGTHELIGSSANYDLLFFRTANIQSPATAIPYAGEHVIAYGQGHQSASRMAKGVIINTKAVAPARCPRCSAQQVFSFVADAGEGFSGGPVVDAKTGALLGIVFGYDDEAGKRFIYAYDMARVTSELQLLRKQSALTPPR